MALQLQGTAAVKPPTSTILCDEHHVNLEHITAQYHRIMAKDHSIWRSKHETNPQHMVSFFGYGIMQV